MNDAAIDTTEQPQSLGAMIDEIQEIRGEISGYEAAIKALKERKEALEMAVIAAYDEQGMTMGRGHAATATIVEAIVPQVVDWDAFLTHVVEGNAPYLLERRAAVGAYRELHQAGDAVPGVVPFTRRTLSVRKLSK